jgi:hypothetical protein
MPAKRKMKGSRYGQVWTCVCCGETVPWFLETRADGPDPNICVACQCDSCLDGGIRVQNHLGACGKRLARCDAWLRRDVLKDAAPDIAARNRSWSALVREYRLKDLHVLFQLSKAEIISAGIPSAADETKIRLYEHHIHGNKKMLRIQMAALSPRERRRVANGHPSAWKMRVIDLCRKHYAGLSAVRVARGGSLRLTDRLNARDIALRVIDRMRLSGKLSSRWIQQGQPTQEMLAETRRLARIVRDERRGRSGKWIADRKDS